MECYQKNIYVDYYKIISLLITHNNGINSLNFGYERLV